MGGSAIPRLIAKSLAALLLAVLGLSLAPASATAWEGGGRRSHHRSATPATVAQDGSGITDPAERAEIRRMLDRIAAGGPFRHRQDGVVFGNREGRLPAQARGYYHEYTVETPGARDRGARRIIRGQSGELYYTRDHYRTFQKIDPESFR